MKHRRILTTGLAALVLLLASCGQKHKATRLVEDFIEQYALQPDEIEHRDYEHFDSTKVISDSLLQSMQAKENPLFRHPIPYPVTKSGRMLYLLRMNYVHKGDTLWHTFYIDEGLEHIVAFK